MNRFEAEQKLKQIFGIDRFYDEQWEAIDRILKGERILMIQKTGFGKSLCYQFPATQFSGVTVIFSPLIALMRDQVKSLNQKGISARFINSEQTPEENAAVIEDALGGKVKILYIAPERQEDRKWVEATRQLNLSMVVIDEAHTISVWGHDFRTAFRRIVDLVQLLPENLPVLATTATATKRTQRDIEEQIAGKLSTYRGSLVRDNFNMYVIKVHSEDDKMMWLAENLSKIRGSGLIYTGTRVDTEIYSKWLVFNGINSIYYNAGLDVDTRIDIENGLMQNKWKCVVSTNALGMGIDKPDIRFVIHTQIPASPIHYYQEIGRAGRDGLPTTIILFFNESKNPEGFYEDYMLPKSFIEGARPSLKKYQKVIDILKEEPLGERNLMKKANLTQKQVRVIKTDLVEQGIVKEVDYGKNKVCEYQYNAPLLNTQSFEDLRIAKLKDLDSMVDYVFTKEPRMLFLCRFLDDDSGNVYQNCDNSNLMPFTTIVDSKYQGKLVEFRETYFPVLPTETKKTNLVNGVAASYYGASNVGTTLHRCKYENGGDFPDYLLRLTLKAYYKTFKDIRFDEIMYVPPTTSGDLVKHFAEKFSLALKIPISHNLVKTRVTSEQKIFQNGYSKEDNVKGAFDVGENVSNKRILLIDDIYDSGRTIKEIGKMLTANGADFIAPVVIAKTIGGDL